MSKERWWRGPVFAIFLLSFSTYAYFYQAGGWNQNSRFDLVRAMVEEGGASIDSYHSNTGDKACRGPSGRCVKAGPQDHYYSDKAPGASWLAVPAYALVHWSAGPIGAGSEGLETAAYLGSLSAVALPSALAVAAFWALLGIVGLRFRPRLGLTLGYGFATLAFPYATLFYGHQLTTALLLLGFVALARERHGKGALTTAGLVAAGLSMGMSVVVEYPSAVPLAAICVYAATWLRPWRRLAWLALGIAVPGLLCALYHFMVFGGPATLPYEFSTQPHRSQGFFMGLGVPEPQVLAELLWGSYRGLLFSAPWLLVALPGAYFFFREKSLRAEAWVAVFIVTFIFWLNASLVDWQGGWAMGPRYLIPAIPFLVLLGAGLFRENALPWPALRTAVSALVCALALYSGHMMLMGTAVKPEVPSVIKQPFAEYLRPHFARGELSISTQGIDMAGAPRNAPQRAWNLGERLFRLQGRWSLVPLFGLQALVLLWMWREARGKKSGRESA